MYNRCVLGDPAPSEAPAPTEPKPEPVASTPRLENFAWDSLDVAQKIKRNNKTVLEQCATHEQLKTALLTLTGTCMLNQAKYMRINVHFSAMHGRTKTDEEVAGEIAGIIMTRRERKAKAEARKNAPKPTLKPKTRKTRHQDNPNQILICFGEPDPAEFSSQGATPNPEINAQKSTTGNQSFVQNIPTRRRRNPRRKYDESQQVLIGFDEEVIGGETDQRKAA